LTQTPGSPITPSAGNRCSEAVSGDLGRKGFVIDFASWISDDPATRKPDDASQLDAVTTAQCPSLRTRLVKALGSDSISTALQ